MMLVAFLFTILQPHSCTCGNDRRMEHTRPQTQGCPVSTAATGTQAAVFPGRDQSSLVLSKQNHTCVGHGTVSSSFQPQELPCFP